jgi:hypothetical protein
VGERQQPLLAGVYIYGGAVERQPLAHMQTPSAQTEG